MSVIRFHPIPRLMMVVFCAALFCLGLPASSARAGEDGEVSWDFPHDSPLATLTAPVSWNPATHEYGINGVSPDSKTFFNVEIVKGRNETEAVARIVDYLNNTGFPVTEASKSETTVTIVGLNARRLIYSIKTARGPETLMIDIARLRSGDNLVVQRWGVLAENSRNVRGLRAIMATLKLKR